MFTFWMYAVQIDIMSCYHIFLHRSDLANVPEGNHKEATDSAGKSLKKSKDIFIRKDDILRKDQD